MPKSPQEAALALEGDVRQILADNPRIPGLSAAIVRGDDIVWTRAFGYADLEARKPMTPDSILNAGSVTKMVTATAILLLIENGDLQLDTDVNWILDFPLRNPAFPDIPIRVCDLLLHRSSILDTERYTKSYVCGDQTQSMGDWLADYFSHETNSFHQWSPGTENPPEEPDPYSNVAYGVLGQIIERASGMPYEQYYRNHIFNPLGMTSTGFLLSKIDRDRHAVPYSSISELEEMVDHPTFAGKDSLTILPRSSAPNRELVENGQFPHCLYSFGTPTDGLMRTTVKDLSRFLSLYIGGGATRSVRLLNASSMALAFPETADPVTWWDYEKGLPGGIIWHFAGGDPGISSIIGVQPQQGIGVAVICNYNGVDSVVEDIAVTLLESSSKV